MNNSENNKRIAKNTLMLYVRMLVIMALSLYTSRVVLQTLGIEDFGVMNVVGGVVAMFSCLNGSFASSSSRFITFELGKPNKGIITDVFSGCMTIQIGLAIIIFIFLETLGLYLVLNKIVVPEGRMIAAIIVYQLSIFTCLINVTQVPYTATIIGHELMNIYAYVSVAEAILKLAIVYLLVISSFDKLILYATLLFILQASIAMSYRFYCYRKFKYIRFKLCKDKTILKPMLGFSGWDMYGTVSTMLSGQGINIIQNSFWGTIVNASVGVADSVKNAVLGFANNFLLATKPQIVKYYASGDIKSMQELAINAGKFSFLLLACFACPLIIECKYVMRLWLVEVPKYAVIFCQLSFVYSLISVMFQPCIHCIHAVGKMKIISFITGTLFYMMIPVAYILLKIGYSPVAPFISNIVIISIISLIYLIILNHYIKEFSILNYLKKVTFVGLFIVIMAVIAPLLAHYYIDEGFLRLVLVVVLSTTSLVLMTWVIGMNQSQRNYVLGKCMSIIKRNYE